MSSHMNDEYRRTVFKRDYDKLAPIDENTPKSIDDYFIAVNGGDIFTHNPIKGVADEVWFGEDTYGLREKLVIQRMIGPLGREMWHDAFDAPADLPDHEMAGGYPYDAIQHVDRWQAILPGLGGMDKMDVICADRRDLWQDVTQQCGVLIGELDDRLYILDPVTKTAISPAFRRIVDLTDERVILDILGNRSELHELRAVDILDDGFDDPRLFSVPYDTYPTFLLRKTLLLTRANSTQLVNIEATSTDLNVETPSGYIVASNPFDLEVAGNRAAMRGREVFDRAMIGAAQYAAMDKDAFRAFRQPDTPLRLPQVASPLVTAELYLQTNVDGSSSVHVKGQDTFGVSLVRGVDGAVMLIVGDEQVVLTSRDEGYCELTDKAGAIIDTYFARLFYEKTNINPDALHEIRQKLGRGGIGAWQASRRLRRAARRR